MWDDLTIRTALEALAKFGITSAWIPFYGSGDEGNVGDLEHAGTENPVDVPAEFVRKLRDLVYEGLPPGFEINEGSDGYVTFDVTNGRVTLSITSHDQELIAERGRSETMVWHAGDWRRLPAEGIGQYLGTGWTRDQAEKYIDGVFRYAAYMGGVPVERNPILRLILVLDPLSMIRVANRWAFGEADAVETGWRQTLLDGLVELVSRPPLIPVPLPAPDDPIKWFCLFAHIGGMPFRVLFDDGDISTHFYDPTNDRYHSFYYGPWMNELVSIFVEEGDSMEFQSNPEFLGGAIFTELEVFWHDRGETEEEVWYDQAVADDNM